MAKRKSQLAFIIFIFFILTIPFYLNEWNHFRPAISLFLGVILSLVFKNPFLHLTKKWAPHFLAFSVVGLGLGMNFFELLKSGISGLGYTVLTIFLTFLLGKMISFFLQQENKTSLLITAGTAICGGSAIAAMAPAIKADDHEISMALATVFILNAVGLILFPKLGYYFELTPEQFGLWCALAIHDTSSVVGASIQYGEKALEVGTTIKMSRALWIIPVTLIVSYLNSKKENKQILSSTNEKAKKAKFPWFILGLILASALGTTVPLVKIAAPSLVSLAKNGLIMTLFLIGSNINYQAIKEVGVKSLLLGASLWMLVTSISLWAIINHIIKT